MLSAKFLETVALLRKDQHALDAQFPGSCPLSEDDYINSVSLLLSEMERLELDGTSKYLAKKYFDLYLATISQIDPQKIILVLLTCLRISAKFNQNSQINSQFTIEFAMRQCEGQYAHQEFIACQLMILSALKFKLKLVTPYDYFQVFNILPTINFNYEALEHTIDFCLSLSESKLLTSEEIFFGSLLYCYRKDHQNNGETLFQKVMMATTFKWEQATVLCHTIEDKVKQIQENELDQSEMEMEGGQNNQGQSEMEIQNWDACIQGVPYEEQRKWDKNIFS